MPAIKNRDAIFGSWLQTQHEEGMALAGESDILKLQPVGTAWPPRHYIASYLCRILVRDPNSSIGDARRFVVGFFFPSDYLIRASTAEVLTWIEPRNIFHPNILPSRNLICIGHMRPGMLLVDLLYQVFEIATYYTYSTGDALDPSAAAFARQNRHRFPTEGRPLRRVRASAKPVQPRRKS